jgi:hypothetical protein
MKRKIIYMLVFIISVNTFSFAKQVGKNCDKKRQAVNCTEQKKTLSTQEMGLDISPLNLLLS